MDALYAKQANEQDVTPVSRSRARRTLIRRTQELGPTEHGEIFKILTAHGVDHTQNNNGIFVNLSRVSDDVMDEVQRFVDYCVENKQDLDEYDKRLNECKRSQDYERFMGSGSDAAAAAAAASSGGDHGAGNDASGVRTDPSTVTPHPPHDDDVPVTTPTMSASDGLVTPTRNATMVASVAKRILNSKFHQAKKKYSKRKLVADRKQASDGAAAVLLSPEPYIF